MQKKSSLIVHLVVGRGDVSVAHGCHGDGRPVECQNVPSVDVCLRKLWAERERWIGRKKM